jgi:hypothetical protein
VALFGPLNSGNHAVNPAFDISTGAQQYVKLFGAA